MYLNSIKKKERKASAAQTDKTKHIGNLRDSIDREDETQCVSVSPEIKYIIRNLAQYILKILTSFYFIFTILAFSQSFQRSNETKQVKTRMQRWLKV